MQDRIESRSSNHLLNLEWTILKTLEISPLISAFFVAWRAGFAGQSSDDFRRLERVVFGVEIRLHGLARVFSGSNRIKGGFQMAHRFDVLGGGVWG